jgi:fibronectin type 3 domain-containing protein
MEIKAELTGARLNWYSRPYSGSDRNLVTAGYQIYRKAADETDFHSIARVNADAASYVDNDMRNGVTYSYALTSVNPDNVESEFSSVLESKTAQAAANVKATGGARKVLLSWTPSDLPGIDGYLIYRAAGAAENYKKVGQASGKSASSYQDNGLEDNSTYWYRIAASVGGGESPKSDPVSATTRQRPPAPAAPAASNNEPRRVVLTWKATGAPEDEVKGYRLYRAAQKDGAFALVAEVGGDQSSYNDGLAAKGGFKLFTSDSKPLADGATYWYRITCFNGAGSESLPSETVSATTRPLLPAPKQLKASSGLAGKVTLSWESAPEFKEYEVYRGAVGQNEVTRLKTVKEGTYEDSEVEHGASYIYAVKGIDENEIPSLITTSVTGSTKPRPKAPWGLKVKDQGGAKLIQWEPSPEKDVVRYIVYRKNFVGIFQKLQPVYGTSFVLEVSKGTHELRVSAEDSDGLESEKSDVLSVEFN